MYVGFSMVLGFPMARVFPVFTGLPSTLVLHIYIYIYLRNNIYIYKDYSFAVILIDFD